MLCCAVDFLRFINARSSPLQLCPTSRLCTKMSRRPECPVCLEDLFASSPVTTPCGHSFCTECLRKTIREGLPRGVVLCPTCRSPIQQNERDLRVSVTLRDVMEALVQASAPSPAAIGGVAHAASSASASSAPASSAPASSAPNSRASTAQALCGAMAAGANATAAIAVDGDATPAAATFPLSAALQVAAAPAAAVASAAAESDAAARARAIADALLLAARGAATAAPAAVADARQDERFAGSNEARARANWEASATAFAASMQHGDDEPPGLAAWLVDLIFLAATYACVFISLLAESALIKLPASSVTHPLLHILRLVLFTYLANHACQPLLPSCMRRALDSSGQVLLFIRFTQSFALAYGLSLPKVLLIGCCASVVCRGIVPFPNRPGDLFTVYDAAGQAHHAVLPQQQIRWLFCRASWLWCIAFAASFALVVAFAGPQSVATTTVPTGHYNGARSLIYLAFGAFFAFESAMDKSTFHNSLGHCGYKMLEPGSLAEYAHHHVVLYLFMLLACLDGVWSLIVCFVANSSSTLPSETLANLATSPFSLFAAAPVLCVIWLLPNFLAYNQLARRAEARLWARPEEHRIIPRAAQPQTILLRAGLYRIGAFYASLAKLAVRAAILALWLVFWERQSVLVALGFAGLSVCDLFLGLPCAGFGMAANAPFEEEWEAVETWRLQAVDIGLLDTR